VAKWTKRSLRLNDDHNWKSKPGYQIFVYGRGAVRFDIPVGWVVVGDDDGGIKIYDRQPPDETCGLQMTIFHLPKQIDWSQLPLGTLFAQALSRPDRDIIGQTPIAHVLRPGLECVWNELSWIDAGERREARSRNLLARADNIQPFITLTFWADDAKRLEPVWQELLRSLRVAQFVSDPRRGPRE
jgi:hypothetical protein